MAKFGVCRLATRRLLRLERGEGGASGREEFVAAPQAPRFTLRVKVTSGEQGKAWDFLRSSGLWFQIFFIFEMIQIDGSHIFQLG